ncbi:hypothetical protein ACHAXR_008830 [Thalassiosira sp. AJA248-18]
MAVEEATTKNSKDDGSTASSTCSDDTNEAFLEMLGLPALDGLSTMATTENDCTEDELATTAIHKAYETNNSLREEIISCSPSVTLLEVPHRCSRYMHQPSDVAAFVIDNFLDASECQDLIQLATKLSSTGFHYVTEAAHTDNEGVTHKVKLQEPNKHKLSVFEHASTVDKLWKKMKPIILPHIGPFIDNTHCGLPLGLNPRLRVLRYDASYNDVFEPHFDATTKVGDKTSLMTVLIYLNDGAGADFDGGETCFIDSPSYIDSMSPNGIDAATKITPATGKVAVFEHDLFHSSVPLKFGTKYVMRTDILFELDAKDSVGVDIPRGADGNNKESENTDAYTTLLEVCQKQLGLSEEMQMELDGIGLLDLTLDSLFAPGVLVVREMLHDVLDEDTAERLMKAALECR